MICSGGWNSNKSSALQLGHPSTRGPWDLRSRCKEEWPAYVSRGGNDLPRPIQIFVAAEKNGPPAERHYHSAASILDFGPRLGNRCKVSPGNVIHRASILNFRARFGSRCKLCRVPGRSSRGICAVAALLCRLPGRSPRGPLQRWDLSRSRAARRATIPFCGVRPRESKLSTAWPPKRNQHRLCDADSLIISALR